MAVGTEKRFSMIGLIYAADDAILDSRSFPRDDGRSDRVFRDNVARTADSYFAREWRRRPPRLTE